MEIAARGYLSRDGVLLPARWVHVAADLAHQVSQQGRRQPFPVRQVEAVLAHDGCQGTQIPFAGHRGRHHETPPTTLLRLYRRGHPQNIG
jgi:hypothetical protein